MQTITATNARSNLFNLLKKILRGHLITRISSKEGNVVILPEEDYESLLETAELLSVPGLKESIAESDKQIAQGDIVALEDIFPKT